MCSTYIPVTIKSDFNNVAKLIDLDLVRVYRQGLYPSSYNHDIGTDGKRADDAVGGSYMKFSHDLFAFLYLVVMLTPEDASNKPLFDGFVQQLQEVHKKMVVLETPPKPSQRTKTRTARNTLPAVIEERSIVELYRPLVKYMVKLPDFRLQNNVMEPPTEKLVNEMSESVVKCK